MRAEDNNSTSDSQQQEQFHCMGIENLDWQEYHVIYRRTARRKEMDETDLLVIMSHQILITFRAETS